MMRRQPTLAGKPRVVDASGNVGRAVVAVLQVHRQRGEVGVVLLEYDLLHWGLL
jgi:hypothetical protein